MCMCVITELHTYDPFTCVDSLHSFLHNSVFPYLSLQVTTELFIRVQAAPSNLLNSAPFFNTVLEPLPPSTFILLTNSSFSVELVALMEDVFDEDSTILPLTLLPDGAQLVAMETEWVQVGESDVNSNFTNATNGTTSDASITPSYGKYCV